MTHRLEAAMWAYNLLRNQSFVIIDTETTGKGNDAQICQIAGISPTSSTGWQLLVKPTIPIEQEAFEVHGITDDLVAHAPHFDDVLIDLLKFVGNRDVVFFNAEFDLQMLRQSARARGIQLAFPTSDRRQCRIFTNGGSIHCAMLHYSKWVGEWSFSRCDYKFQPLPGGDHTALGDCQATLALIQKLANEYVIPPKSDSEPYDDIPF